MSGKQTQDPEEGQGSDSEVLVTKKVTILGYLNDKGVSLREAADNVLEDVDMFSMHVDEDTYRYFRLGGMKKQIYEDERWEELSSMDLGDGELVEETTKSREFDYSTDRLANNVWSDISIFDQLEVPEGWTERFGRQLRESGGDGSVRVYRRAIEVPMVKHPSQMDGTEDNPYVNEDVEYNAVKFRIVLHSVTPEMAEYFTDNMVDPFVDALADHDTVERVRWMDCENKQEETGVCYDI